MSLSNKDRQKRWRQRHRGLTIKVTAAEAIWIANNCRHPNLRKRILNQLV
jgi:hypothetical protein